jgi:EpsI family protein
MMLPTVVGSFVGRDEVPSEGEKHVLPSDTEIVKKTYRDSAGNLINAEIVLAGAEKRSIHRPELCLPAQGWSINERATMPVKLNDGRAIAVMNDFISRTVETSPGVTHPLESYFSYWFVGNGVTTSSHVMRLFLTSWDRVLHHKNHRWAYVAISAPVLKGFKQDGKNAEETRQMISDFIAEIAPQVMKHDGEIAEKLTR